jgi:hypothetical protein
VSERRLRRLQRKLASAESHLKTLEFSTHEQDDAPRWESYAQALRSLLGGR